MNNPHFFPLPPPQFSRSNGDASRKLNTAQLGDLLDASNMPHFKGIPIIVDLAFASNVRFLDEYELHLTDVELYKVTRTFGFDKCRVQ